MPDPDIDDLTLQGIPPDEVPQEDPALVPGAEAPLVSPVPSTVAPIQAAVPTAPTATDRQTRVRQVEDELLNEAGGAGGASASTRTSQLASAAPSWYQQILGPPPKAKNPTLGNLAGLLVSSAVADKDKPPRAFLRGKDGHPAAWKPDTAGGQQAGEFVQGAINRDPATEDYNRNLQAAQGQANLVKTLNSSSRGSANSAQSKLGILNYLQHGRQLQDSEDAAAAKAEEARQANDMNSEVTQRAREAAVTGRFLTPDSAERMTAAQINKYQVRFGQQAQRDWRGVENDIMADRRVADKMGSEERAQEYKFATEGREQENKDADAYIPGLRIHGHAPPIAAQNEARKIKAVNDKADAALDRLIKNDAKIKAAARTGAWYAALGSDEEQKRLLVEMQNDALTVQSGIRESNGWGAPQDAEFRIANTINPPPTSLKGWAQGKYIYPDLKKQLARDTRHGLAAHGYFYPGEAPSEAPAQASTDRPTEEKIIRHAKPEVRRYTPTGIGGSSAPPEPVPQAAPGDSLSVVPGAPPPVPIQKPTTGRVDPTIKRVVVNADGSATVTQDGVVKIMPKDRVTPEKLKALGAMKGPDGTLLWNIQMPAVEGAP